MKERNDEREMESILGIQNQIVSSWISSCKNKSCRNSWDSDSGDRLVPENIWADRTSSLIGCKCISTWEQGVVSSVSDSCFCFIITVFIFQNLYNILLVCSLLSLQIRNLDWFIFVFFFHSLHHRLYKGSYIEIFWMLCVMYNVIFYEYYEVMLSKTFLK